MKNLLLCCSIICYLVSVEATGQTPVSDYGLVPTASVLKWTGYYLFNFGEHTGTIAFRSGAFAIDGQGVLTGSASIDMHTVKDLDMPYDDGGRDVAEHLMSKDFFDAEKYPRARIDITKSEPIADAREGAPNTKLTASLTIREVTHPIAFEALVTRSISDLKATGKFKFDRTLWGVEYNSGKVFSEVGDGAISDAVAIEFSIIAQAK
jgi:polyisoprenoid-binding protein YceI